MLGTPKHENIKGKRETNYNAISGNPQHDKIKKQNNGSKKGF